MNASGRVARPSAIPTPATTSMTPAAPISDIRLAAPPPGPIPPNQPNSFCAPCEKNSTPATIRNRVNVKVVGLI